MGLIENLSKYPQREASEPLGPFLKLAWNIWERNFALAMGSYKKNCGFVPD